MLMKRFSQLLRWSWAHSPRWYLFAHLAACVVFALFYMIGLVGMDKERLFIREESLLALLTLIHLFSLGIVACHFLARHFSDQRSATDYYSLPVSYTERAAVLLFVLWVALPLYGLLSSVLIFGVASVFSSIFVLPPLAIALKSMLASLLVYGLVSIPLLSWTLLRPKQSFWSALGIAAAIASIFGLTQAAGLIRSENLRYVLPENSMKQQAVADVYGPSIQQMSSWDLEPMMHWQQHPLPIIIGILLVVLFLASAVLALKNRQV